MGVEGRAAADWQTAERLPHAALLLLLLLVVVVVWWVGGGGGGVVVAVSEKISNPNFFSSIFERKRIIVVFPYHNSTGI